MKRIILIILLIILAVAPASQVFVYAQTESLQDRRARLEAELLQYEQEIKEKEATLAQQRSQSGSLKRDVDILTTEIANAKLKIKSRTLAITKLSDEINNKEQKIETLSEKLDNQKESLAQLIRKTDELDNTSFVHLVLSSESLSGFYGDVDSFAVIKGSLKTSVDELNGIKTETEVEKASLEDKKDEEVGVKLELESQKKKVELTEAEKKKLLTVSKGKEKEYEKVVAEKKAKAASIRAALFELAGGTTAISFGQALEYANMAEARTGIRAAFLLGILTQESNLGQNTGSCYLTNTSTGAGVGIKTNNPISKVMSPTRDVPPFISITSALGRDPYKTLVSCPQSIGWGGAMGPSQFIPSTWKLYEKRIASALGIDVPDPWRASDAFMASALYLVDLGAGSQVYANERNAACKYYSGKSCSSLRQAANYGNSVMSKASYIQQNQIDPLKNL
jgi:peptidoglycan hydrolase CwlO-like protein